MATCGSCKETGKDVQHIKECYATKYAAKHEVTENKPQASDYRPIAFLLPESKYAVTDAHGVMSFYAIQHGKGKWAGEQFLVKLIGAPGDWRKVTVYGMERKRVMAEIDTNAKAAAVRFGKHFTVCACCGSPLSDPESVALGIGPVCAKRF